MPKHIRAQAGYLAEAESRYKNPKLAHQYDPNRVLEARKQCVAHLEKIDKRANRSYRLISIITSIAVNFLILAAIITVALNYIY